MKLIWTPADVEEETLSGYWWSLHGPPMPDIRVNPRLNAWNRAVVLGGEHYEAWRREHIAPIEQAHREKYLNSGPYLSRWRYHRVGHKWVWEPRDRREKIRSYYLASYVPKRTQKP